MPPRLVSNPRGRAKIPKTMQANGIENFLWISTRARRRISGGFLGSCIQATSSDRVSSRTPFDAEIWARCSVANWSSSTTSRLSWELIW